MTDTLDINLYDRQIRTYGLEAVQMMNSSSILIYGLAKGMGTEVGKNLALGGIKTIYLYDDNLITVEDTINGYYYNDMIGMKRSHVLATKLMELNPYIKAIPVSDYMQNQYMTIVINQPNNIVSDVNKYCRRMVAVWCDRFNGSIFVDAGDNHIITDATGENIENVQIANITNNLVEVAANNSHEFAKGDTITFTNLEGTNI